MSMCFEGLSIMVCADNHMKPRLLETQTQATRSGEEIDRQQRVGVTDPDGLADLSELRFGFTVVRVRLKPQERTSDEADTGSASFRRQINH
jgi:hypothetical protein